MEVSVFLLNQIICLIFSKRKICRDTIRKNKGISKYTHKKKNNGLENHAYFPIRHYSQEHNIMEQFSWSRKHD